MGVQVWVRRDRADAAAATEAVSEATIDERSDSGPAAPVRAAPELAAPEWVALQGRMAQCTACALHGERARCVLGVGARPTDWMVVGPAPRIAEERQGEACADAAGRLLEAMLGAVGRQRREVYLTPVVKCRCPDGRDPQPAELSACAAFLEHEVAAVRPKVILALGGVAAGGLLGHPEPLEGLRGRVHRYGQSGIALVVTHEPAFLLGQPQAKRQAWEDLLLACETVRATRPQT